MNLHVAIYRSGCHGIRPVYQLTQGREEEGGGIKGRGQS